MKLVYMCRTESKYWGLREQPLTENVWGEGVGGGGLSERPLTGKTGEFGAKNNKETYILFKTRVFSICPGRKSGTKNCIFLKKGVFWSGPGRKSSLRSGQGRKMGGCFRAAHTRIVLIWEYPPGDLSHSDGRKVAGSNFLTLLSLFYLFAFFMLV